LPYSAAEVQDVVAVFSACSRTHPLHKRNHIIFNALLNLSNGLSNINCSPLAQIFKSLRLRLGIANKPDTSDAYVFFCA